MAGFKFFENQEYCVHPSCPIECIRNQSTIPKVLYMGRMIKDTSGKFINTKDFYTLCPWNPKPIGGRYGH